MILSKVTVTGADNNTDPQALIDLSREFPFVEWGILFSKKRTNTPRYPIKHYGLLLSYLSSGRGVPVNLSAHICGEWTREFFNGDFTFDKYFTPFGYQDIFNRVQLNFNAANYPYKLDKVVDIIKEHHFTEFIFQYNRSNFRLCNEVLEKDLKNIAFLYDSSGGRGTTRTDWPTPIRLHYTGYAGGLNTINLQSQLELINEVVNGDDEIWIDVETGVRDSDDNLNLDKVRQFLEIASKHVTINA